MDYSSSKKLIDVLVLNLKTVILALVKVRKKDFCIVLAGKQQRDREKAPWSGHTLFNERLLNS